VAWDDRQKKQEPSPEPQNQTVANHQAEPEPDKPTQEQSKEPLVVDASRATENKKKGPYSFPNQDASFVDKKSGTFGVFDGVSSSMMGKEIADAAASQIATGLAGDLPHDFDEAQKHVGQVVKDVSKKLSQEETARYQTVFADIQRLVSGAISADNFDQKYAISKMQSDAQWIKMAIDAGKPDELPQEVKDWTAKRIRGATTGSVVKIWLGESGERKAIIANIGDSRVYHYSTDERKLKIATVDDNLLNELVGKERALEIQEEEGTGRDTNDILKGQKIILERSNPRHVEAWETSFLQKRFP
jgi:serine/threonine protein phosphatase PrpC